MVLGGGRAEGGRARSLRSGSERVARDPADGAADAAATRERLSCGRDAPRAGWTPGSGWAGGAAWRGRLSGVRCAQRRRGTGRVSRVKTTFASGAGAGASGPCQETAAHRNHRHPEPPPCARAATQARGAHAVVVRVIGAGEIVGAAAPGRRQTGVHLMPRFARSGLQHNAPTVGGGLAPGARGAKGCGGRPRPGAGGRWTGGRTSRGSRTKGAACSGRWLPAPGGSEPGRTRGSSTRQIEHK